MWRNTLGGILFAGFLWLLWRLVGARLWRRGVDPPLVERNRTFF
ncbi:MAG: hypothetical protein ABGX79_01225 [Acidimicrobiales bacterium]